LPEAEYRELCRKRARVHDAGQRLYAAAKARRLALCDGLRTLARIEAGAHRAGPSEEAWVALAIVYSERPGIEAELNGLESGSADDAAKAAGVQ
jgi:hypothetical protein